eukprot:642367-Rhodomonas_salina.1
MGQSAGVRSVRAAQPFPWLSLNSWQQASVARRSFTFVPCSQASGSHLPVLTLIWEDNAACIQMSENLNQTHADSASHIDSDMHLYFLRDMVRDGHSVVKLIKVLARPWGHGERS